MTGFLSIHASVTWLALNKCWFPFPSFKNQVVEAGGLCSSDMLLYFHFASYQHFLQDPWLISLLGHFASQLSCVHWKVCYETVVPYLSNYAEICSQNQSTWQSVLRIVHQDDGSRKIPMKSSPSLLTERAFRTALKPAGRGILKHRNHQEHAEKPPLRGDFLSWPYYSWAAASKLVQRVEYWGVKSRCQQVKGQFCTASRKAVTLLFVSNKSQPEFVRVMKESYWKDRVQM